MERGSKKGPHGKWAELTFSLSKEMLVDKPLVSADF